MILSDIAHKDSRLARTVAHLTWFSDGVGKNEEEALRRLLRLVSKDLELARNAASLGWFVDDVNGTELDALYTLQSLAAVDLELARNTTSLSWFVDDVSGTELDALYILQSLASFDRELARITATLSWFADEMTTDKNRALWDLRELVYVDADLAVEIVNASNLWSPRLVANSLSSLRFFRQYSPERFNVLAAKSWFADGLSRQDAAFLSILSRTLGSPALYDELVEAHYVKSKTIDVPLGGQVNIWLFSNKPIDPRDRLLDDVAQAIWTGEDFMRVPFPDRDFLVLLAVGHHSVGAYHFDSHIVVSRSEVNDQVDLHTVFHETAHHYMQGFGSAWLVEGGADFLATIGLAQVGIRDLDRWPSYVERLQRRECALYSGLDTIQDIIDYQEDSGAVQRCNYVLGEYFLHSLRTAMGHDAIGAALAEIYRTEWETKRGFEEETIYELILKNTPDSRKESVQNIYRELHGGPFVATFVDAESELLIPGALESELQELLPWFNSPPDKIHSSALAAIVKVWQLNPRLGLSLAKAAWVVDGVNHGEAIVLNGLYEISTADPQLTDRVVNYAWVRDGVVFWERRAIEAISRLALHTPDDAERVARYSWVVDNMTNEERLLLQFLAELFVTVDGTGRSMPSIDWMLDGLTDPEHRLLLELRGILDLDTAYCLEVLALPGIADGPSSQESEAGAVQGLAQLVVADKQLANDVIQLEWVLDDLDTLEAIALGRIGAVAAVDVQDAEQIVNSPWFRDGIESDDVLRLLDYHSS